MEEIAGRRVASPGVYLQQMPYPCYKRDRYAHLLGPIPIHQSYSIDCICITCNLPIIRPHSQAPLPSLPRNKANMRLASMLLKLPPSLLPSLTLTHTHKYTRIHTHTYTHTHTHTHTHSFTAALLFVLPLTMVFAWLFPVAMTTRAIVQEKAVGVRCKNFLHEHHCVCILSPPLCIVYHQN